MKIILFLALWCLTTVDVAGQVIQVESVITRTVPATKQTRLDREMLRFLLFTHEADKATDGQALFQVPLLGSAKSPGIGIYKFGLNSAHAGYNVVFRYRYQLVFSSARSVSPLLAQLRHFLGQYPAAFTPQAQRSAEGQLRDMVQHNQTTGESDLPARKG
ncbi:hypothetical protein ACFP2F_12740 [Hymenobacter artigasi]|uniref:Uncharacterized protein n=1 Tax=Hymenobacter artigasi TaxID=2719616 RepID=A0ABX1HD85_9BACT|nr:hypothetical protein [Hymenobacter artigasi]NKI88216.1 hypothetical protein [Hymenobacter artigasi]